MKSNVAQSGIHAQRERQAIHRGNQIRRNPIALRIILDPIEKNRRPSFRALVDNFRERRELEIPVDVVNSHQLAELVDFV